MLKLTQTQLAYLAGFIDGDSSIYVRLKPNDTYRLSLWLSNCFLHSSLSISQRWKKFPKICNLLSCGYLRKRKDGILEYIISRKLEEIFRKKDLVKNIKDFSKLMDLINKFVKINYSKKRSKHKLTP